VIHAIRILLVVVIVEAAVSVGLLAYGSWRTAPQIPDVELNDPLVMPRLRELARAAEFGNSDDWRRLGEALLGKGFYAHAELAFREALRLDPQNFPSQFGLAFSLDRTGRTGESSPEYEKLLRLPEQSSDQRLLKYHALYALGRNALREENVAAAEEWFRRNSGFPPADYQLAKLLIRSGRAEEALPLVERNLANIPYSLEFHFLKHRACLELGRPRAAFKAAAMMERSARLVSMNFNTDYVAPLNARLGVAAKLRELGKVSRGDDLDRIEQLSREIASLLEDAPVFTARHVEDLLIDVAARKKQPKRMLEMLDALREKGREDAFMLEYEGDAWNMLGQADKAAKCWRRALTLAPTIRLHRKLVEYYGERDPAQRDRHLAGAALRTGIAEYRGNRLEEAIPPLREATQLNPQDPAPWYYLGEMNFHLGRFEKARAAYQHCLQLQPGHGRAAAKLAYLEGGEDA
jgi:Flp pilus assembly protein TadD